MMKQCSKCGEERELSLFYKSNKSLDGLQSSCTPCEKARKTGATARKQRASQYQNNKEKVKEKARDYYHQNKDRQKERKRQYYFNNKEHLNKKNKEYQELNKEQLKDKAYQDKYGISLAEFNQRRAEQNYSCYVCSKPETENTHQTLFVDHCHSTGKVRKLLCSSCNFALGHIKDDRTLLARLDQYLKDHA